MFSRELQRTLAAERPEELPYVPHQQVGLFHRREVAAVDGSPNTLGGSDRGSPNRGSTLVSKRVIMLTWSPASVSTIILFALCGSATPATHKPPQVHLLPAA
jgi:hypothetical protein